MRTLLLGIWLTGCAETPPAPVVETPTVETPTVETPASVAAAPVYDLSLPLTDQADQPATLDRYRGHPTILSMFYASCSSACPLLIAEVQGIEQKLSPAARDRLRVMLVSFDPGHDRGEVLRGVVADHHLDTARWTLARGDEDGVRLLAAVLGIQYQRLSDGGFNHSSVLVLVDGDGVPQARLGSLAEDTTAFVAAAEGLGGSR